MDDVWGKNQQNCHPYAGRWIARIRNQVIGQGGSARQALAAAYASRFKEIPIISYIPLQTIMAYSPIVFQIQKILLQHTGIYLVGGAVRDALRGKISHDLDFVCEDDVKNLARITADALQADFYTMDKDRGIYRVICHSDDQPSMMIDFSAFRGKTLEDDLLGRDFTINAMAVDLQDPYKLIDPLGGAQALKDHLLAACLPGSFQDDPVRLLRGIRFAAEWDFHLEKQTRQQMKLAIRLLADTSIERRRDEFMKILASGKPDTGLRALNWLNALEYLVPGLTQSIQSSGKEWWEELLASIQSANELMALLDEENPHTRASDFASGLYAMKVGPFRDQIEAHMKQKIHPDHGHLALFFLSMITSAMAGNQPIQNFYEQLGMELKLSRQEENYLIGINKGFFLCKGFSIASAELKPVDIYHYYQTTRTAGVDAALIFTASVYSKERLAADQAAYSMVLDLCQKLLDGWWNHQEDWVNPVQLVDGNDLMQAMGVPPSQEVGKWLQLVMEKQVSGELNTISEALEWLKKQKIS